MVNIKEKLMAIGLASFLLGVIFSSALSPIDLQKPLGIFGSDIKSMPADRLKDYSVRVFDDKVVIYLSDPYLAKFADTHSMEPALGYESMGLEITPKSSDDIKAGDIISYRANGSDDTIIHRVVKIGHDSEGWYAITKGDNNPGNDAGKVRFIQVKRILVGILY